MKKIYLLIFILLLLTPKVNARTIKVMAVDKFSTENPSNTYKVQTIDAEELEDGIFLEKGTVISGFVVKTYAPQRGKRDSYFEFHPTLITYNKETINISHSKILARVVGYKPIDPEKFVGSVAIKAANFVMLGSSQAISFTLGAFQAPSGEKIKSGFDRMYKESFVSFIEVGEELNIDVGDILILKIKKNN